MKQFDLQEYNRLVAEGKTPKVVTRDGDESVILDTDYFAMFDGEPRHLILAKVLQKNGYWYIRYFSQEDGRSVSDYSCYDLFFSPEKKESWTIMSKSFDKCDTKEAAESLLALVDDKENYIVAKVKWEE